MQEYIVYGFPWWLSGKKSTCQAGDTGLIPGSGRSLGKGMVTHASILAWRTPWTEEPGGLQTMESQKSWMQLSNNNNYMSYASANL